MSTDTEARVASERERALAARTDWNWAKADAYARASVERDEALEELRAALADVTLEEIYAEGEAQRDAGSSNWYAREDSPEDVTARSERTAKEAQDAKAAQAGIDLRAGQRQNFVDGGYGTAEEAFLRFPEPTAPVAAPPKAAAPVDQWIIPSPLADRAASFLADPNATVAEFVQSEAARAKGGE